MIQCRVCNQFLPKPDFHKNCISYCKKCSRELAIIREKAVQQKRKLARMNKEIRVGKRYLIEDIETKDKYRGVAIAEYPDVVLFSNGRVKECFRRNDLAFTTVVTEIKGGN